MNTTDHRIRERLEALLRLAEDPGATPEERARALERVAAMSAKYQIDVTQLDPRSGQYRREDIVTHVFDVPTTYGLETARCHGLFSVLRAMGANGYVQPHRRGKSRRNDAFVVYATQSVMDVLKVLIPSLFLQEANALITHLDSLKQTDPYLRVIRLTMRQAKEQGQDFRALQGKYRTTMRIHRRSFVTAFYVGAADRIRAVRKDAVQRAGQGYALVLVDTEDRIRQAMDGLELTKTRRRGGTAISRDSWERGTAAGKQAMVGQREMSGGRPALES